MCLGFTGHKTLCFQKGAEYVFDSNLLEANAQFTDVIPDYIFEPHFPHS